MMLFQQLYSCERWFCFIILFIKNNLKTKEFRRHKNCRDTRANELHEIKIALYRELRFKKKQKQKKFEFKISSSCLLGSNSLNCVK